VDGTIDTVPSSFGVKDVATTFAIGTAPRGIAADSERAFWGEGRDGTLRALALTQGGSAAVGEVLLGDAGELTDIRQSGSLVAASSRSEGGGDLTVLPKTGGAPVLDHVPLPNAYAMAFGGDVYLAVGNAVKRVPLDGGAAVDLATQLVGCSNGLALDDTYVYAGCTTADRRLRLLRVAKGGR
jgi:hypothetical protein